MKAMLLLTVLLLTVGCSSNSVIGSHLASIKRNMRNNHANEAYRDTIGDHAEDGTLIGTWTWQSPYKAVFDLPLEELSLSLFEDGIYTQRRIGRSIQNTMVAVTVEVGAWRREAPGMIALTPNKPDPRKQITARTINLSEWTNTFVEADRAIHADE